MLRTRDDSWLLIMVYGRPSSTIVMLSVGVKKVRGRMEVYIVPETTSAVLLLDEAVWTPWTSNDQNHRHKSPMVDYQLPGCQSACARRY